MIYSPGPTCNEYELRVDPAARPATYDIVGVPGGRAARRSFKGIYKIDGDTLTICYNPAGRDRPTAFEGVGRGTFTEVYKRVRR
jgi:uncharacterized protein (TIGR03067 family)